MAIEGSDDQVRGSEIRVHGVGNHDLWSALGSPEILEGFSTKRVQLARPPRHVGHELVLVNWSKLSRSANGILWFLAFPFTLINLAEAMVPVDKVRRRLHRGIVLAASLVLTLTLTCWLIVIVERSLLAFDLPDGLRTDLHYAPVILSGGAIALMVLGRAMWRKESTLHRPSAIATAVAVVGLCLGISKWAPAQIEFDYFGILGLITVEGPTDQQLQSWRVGQINDYPAASYWLDPMALVAYGSLIFSLVCVALLLLLALRSDHPGPYVGSALAVFLGFALLNLVAGSSLAGIGQLSRSAAAKLPVMGEIDLYEPSLDLMLGRAGQSYPTQLFVGVIALILLAFATSFVASAQAPVHAWLRRGEFRATLGEWMHGTIVESVGKLAGALLLTLLLSAALIYGVQMLVDQRGWDQDEMVVDNVLIYSWPSYYRWITSAVGVIAVVVFFWVRQANRFSAWRETLAYVGDVAGFWPISGQPLGARTYRRDVVRGIEDALERTGNEAVLVGHSQGSVLAAWTIAGREHANEEIAEEMTEETAEAQWALGLVTCGSPLDSLYSTYFPHDFDEDFYKDVDKRVGGWVNFWRATDPIATELPLAFIDNVELDDGDDAHPSLVRGHSDYWIEEQQLGRVTALLQTAEQP